MINRANYGAPFSETATHATAAVASHAAVAGCIHCITGFSFTSDKAGAIGIVKQGTTAVWQGQVGAGAHTVALTYPIFGAKGALVSAEIDGTSACKANISGFTFKPAGEGAAIRGY
jgi:hypothetical protein